MLDVFMNPSQSLLAVSVILATKATARFVPETEVRLINPDAKIYEVLLHCISMFSLSQGMLPWNTAVNNYLR